MSETRACGLGAKMRHALCSVTHCRSVFPNFCRDTIAAELARYWFPWCSFLAWPSLQCLMHAYTCLCTRQLCCSPHVCFCVRVKKRKKKNKKIDFFNLFWFHGSFLHFKCSCRLWCSLLLSSKCACFWTIFVKIKKISGTTDRHARTVTQSHSLTHSKLRFLEVCIMLAKNQHFLSAVGLEKCELKF